MGMFAVRLISSARDGVARWNKAVGSSAASADVDCSHGETRSGDMTSSTLSTSSSVL
jgi:hypothetical protein